MKIQVAELERKSKELMMRAGAPERSAQYIAETLVSADLRGISSHGVVRLARYIDCIKSGEPPETCIQDARLSVHLVEKFLASQI